jgi:ParB family chromosome partitioning protein
MKTINKKKMGKIVGTKTTGSKKSHEDNPIKMDGEPANIPLDKIDFSPFNYREFYDEKELELFAGELAIHGVISPITVRPLPKGRYQLVAGERRTRAAKLAQLKTIPAMVRELTDQEVMEIQLSENLQREDPHPMQEAKAIGRLREAKKTMEEISLRLGKSKAFIYSRLKLLDLIGEFQEMFLSSKLTIRQALEMAAVSQESQQELFSEHCRDWKKKGWQMGNLDYLISLYQYNLARAPFNTKDVSLLPAAGSCNHCPFNSATLKSLFPEMAKEAFCGNKSCYQQKCTLHFTTILEHCADNIKPAAIILNGRLHGPLENLLETLPSIAPLPKLQAHEIALIERPDEPDKEDYEYEDEEGGDVPVLDEAAYNTAVEEYKAEWDEYNAYIESGKLRKGLLISGDKINTVTYTTDSEYLASNANTTQITAKAVQEAIKAGTATAELLQAEMERLNTKEERAQEIDKEKIQLKLHEQFGERFGSIENNQLTAVDQLAERLIIYQSMDFSTHELVDTALFGKKPPYETRENLLERLAALNEQQWAFLVRMALWGKSDSKFPRNASADCLCQLATAAGLNVAALEKEQEKKAKERAARLKEKIAELEKRIEKMAVETQ